MVIGGSLIVIRCSWFVSRRAERVELVPHDDREPVGMKRSA
jgi:hypothetical protein